jgi:hypothetical protein
VTEKQQRAPRLSSFLGLGREVENPYPKIKKKMVLLASSSHTSYKPYCWVGD